MAKIKMRHLPTRLSIGAYVLNSGLDKRHADEQAIAQIHRFASGAYPFLKNVDSATFVTLLSGSEIALGAALLLPVIPSLLAGLGLTAFSAGLIGLYLRTPGLRKEGSVRPTQAGVPLAKDVWLLGAGLDMIVDGIVARRAATKTS
jgi:hypothetical protein